MKYLYIFLSLSSVNTFGAPPSSDEILKGKLGPCYSSQWNPPSGPELFVNGNQLSKTQRKNVLWVKHCILPHLPGTREEKLTTASRTTWWSLREGIFNLKDHKIFRYSNCHEGGRDRFRSNFPLYACPGNIWQVGIGAAQVMNYSRKTVSEMKTEIFGENISERALLKWTALLAGYPAGTTANTQIVHSKGKVRRSWMMKNPLIAFQLVAHSEVKDECLIDKKRWCFGKGYPEARKFAVNEAAMLRSIRDLRRIFSSSEKKRKRSL